MTTSAGLINSNEGLCKVRDHEPVFPKESLDDWVLPVSDSCISWLNKRIQPGPICEEWARKELAEKDSILFKELNLYFQIDLARGDGLSKLHMTLPCLLPMMYSFISRFNPLNGYIFKWILSGSSSYASSSPGLCSLVEDLPLIPDIVACYYYERR